MGNPLWFIFWAVIFWFVSLIVAFISAMLYIPIYVLVVCCPGLSDLTDILLKGVQFPHYCGKACWECQAPF